MRARRKDRQRDTEVTTLPFAVCGLIMRKASSVTLKKKGGHIVRHLGDMNLEITVPWRLKEKKTVKISFTHSFTLSLTHIQTHTVSSERIRAFFLIS